MDARPNETVPDHDRRAMIEAWLEGAARTYPERTARLLLGSADQFRNPVGHAFREGLPVLLDAVLGYAELDAVLPVLDGLIGIRAVQDFSADEAVSFIPLLKAVVRERSRLDERIEARIDRLALLSRDVLASRRNRLLAVQANEVRRRTFLRDRMRAS